MKLKRFNEHIEDNTEEINDFGDAGIFESEIFRDIEADVESMLGEDGVTEAIDYLSSIIAFCNQQVKSLEEQDNEEEL